MFPSSLEGLHRRCSLRHWLLPRASRKPTTTAPRRSALCPHEGARSTPHYAGRRGAGKVSLRGGGSDRAMVWTRLCRPGAQPGSLPGSQLCHSLLFCGEREATREGGTPRGEASSPLGTVGSSPPPGGRRLNSAELGSPGSGEVSKRGRRICSPSGVPRAYRGTCLAYARPGGDRTVPWP